jgi:Ca2+:H+ antiporter
MNATMGNLPELIIALFALTNNLVLVVQLSLLGSILSNLLLVLGSAFLLGGIRFKEQSYLNSTSHLNAGLLLMASLCLLLPAVLANAPVSEAVMASPASILTLSRAVSVIMLVVYVLFLVFQLHTHKHLYEEVEDEDEGEKANPKASAVSNPASATNSAASSSSAAGTSIEMPTMSSSSSILPRQEAADEEKAESSDDTSDALSKDGCKCVGKCTCEEEEDEEPPLSLYMSIFWLCVMAAAIAGLSEVLVASIQGAALKSGLSTLFISVILLPIAGNAAEHASAVLFAYKDRLDVTFGVAIGSSIQIALFVAPLIVVVGWGINVGMSLNFGAFETAATILTVVMVSFVIIAGKTNWMVGALLVATYAIIAALFAITPSPAINV